MPFIEIKKTAEEKLTHFVFNFLKKMKNSILTLLIICGNIILATEWTSSESVRMVGSGNTQI